MGSTWRKAKLALGLKLCVYVPETHIDDDSPPPPLSTERLSDAALLSPGTPMTPTPTSRRLRFSKSLSSSSKKMCFICLATMKSQDGQAIFTAECSHSFHFHCISSNVKHGSQTCPVCRAKWKQIPTQVPTPDPPLGKARVNPVDWHQNNAMMTVIRQPMHPRRNGNRQATLLQAPEPAVFNDDEFLDHQSEPPTKSFSNNNAADSKSHSTMTIKSTPEVQAVPRFNAFDNFTILIHLKAPMSLSEQNPYINQANFPHVSQTARAPIDLVTVLDTSGSMAGTKLALLKRAMGFVIQNLSPNDRLAVIAFSSTARRLFPLRRMSATGRQQALQAVNSLIANGGTNIAEGLRKGAKVMEDRRDKNPVSSIILLSDGRDTYTVGGPCGSKQPPNYRLLLPLSIHGEDGSGTKLPVHAFGFGTDHEASLMHSIAEVSGGTFSFIETESMIQDAFAQCIGGLLSVVIKDLQVCIDCVHPTICLGSLKAGSYPNRVMSDGRTGFIDVGELYADEEKDFLALINVPAVLSSNETSLLKVRCVYNDPLTKETVTLEGEEVRIRRTEIAGQEMVSIEVDRQRNRLLGAEAMAQARSSAEQGDLTGAISIFKNCRRVLSETVSAKAGDQRWVALDAELKEMQERMASRHVYEASGRAYILSGLSSHSWQRATARGDTMDGSSLTQTYQTPSMAEMLSRSQATLLGTPSAYRLLRPLVSYASLPKPR